MLPLSHRIVVTYVERVAGLREARSGMRQR
jgi:hypothetical protein